MKQAVATELIRNDLENEYSMLREEVWTHRSYTKGNASRKYVDKGVSAIKYQFMRVRRTRKTRVCCSVWSKSMDSIVELGQTKRSLGGGWCCVKIL